MTHQIYYLQVYGYECKEHVEAGAVDHLSNATGYYDNYYDSNTVQTAKSFNRNEKYRTGGIQKSAKDAYRSLFQKRLGNDYVQSHVNTEFQARQHLNHISGSATGLVIQFYHIIIPPNIS